ncbi:MAG: protein translocase subunit SecF [Patescibacteria group bacterium]|nr:protein translocase subunit SecF [Patescibacteria group bacterium]
MFNFQKNLAVHFIFPGLLVLAALASLVVWGLNMGIDLTGGSLIQVSYNTPVPTVAQIQSATAPLNFGEVRVQPTGSAGFIIRTKALSNDEHNQFIAALGHVGAVHEEEFTTVGPSIGAELLQKAWIAIGLALLLIVAFIAFAFRKVSRPVASWKYGVVAIIALLFDALIPVGVFAALGHFRGAEVDALFIVALLTILGISINDKIVVFDRIRENLSLSHARGASERFGDIVGRSIRQTLARSINTSLTVVIVLVCLYTFGPASTKAFALTLAVGMIVGTYSSIFFASPLLVAWEGWQAKK